LRKVLARLFYTIARLRWRVTRPITLGVRLILEKEHTVLLVKHTYQAQWYLPGGGVGRGETLEEAARREAAEEIGATLGRLRLFGVYTNFSEHKSDHVAIFVCDDFTLTGRTLEGAEIERFDFFGLDNLPAGLSPGTGRRLLEYRNGGGVPVVGMW
jgi:8-oxo-dGTP pyrophosphatase MutT (NUDIX family)